jgi:hypothetical protein
MAASWRDYLVTITPNEGPNRNKAVRLLTGTKMSCDPGAGADHFLGFGELPVDIVRKTNKPKFELSDMDNEEVLKIVLYCGGIGGARFNISVVRQRLNYPTRRLLVNGCEFGDGMKILEADESGGKGTIQCLSRDIKYSPNIATPLTSIYAQTNGR